MLRNPWWNTVLIREYLLEKLQHNPWRNFKSIPAENSKGIHSRDISAEIPEDITIKLQYGVFTRFFKNILIA